MLELNFILSFLFARLASVNINALDGPLPIALSGAYFFKPASISHVEGLALSVPLQATLIVPLQPQECVPSELAVVGRSRESDHPRRPGPAEMRRHSRECDCRFQPASYDGRVQLPI